MPSKDLSSVVLEAGALDTPSDGKLDTQPETLAVEAEADDPFRILIVGDFSGRKDRVPLAMRHPRQIDRDNFDNVLQTLGVQASLRFDTAAVVLTFAALTDFEPDAIFTRCELFRESPPAPPAARPVPTPRSSMESDVTRLTSGSLLDEIVGETAGTPGPTSKNDLQSVIDRVVAPHLVQREDRSAIEHSHSAWMRAILHDPHFQALEAVWRGLDLLVRSLDTDNGLSIHILDVSRHELERGVDDLQWGSQPWAVIAGDYVFGRSQSDIDLLSTLGKLARRAGAPFIAEAAPPNDDPENSKWNALCASPEARSIGLALPRFLARLPYGRATYAIDSFPFEETSGRPAHAEYLWANPAFACALLLGRAFNELGWNFRPGAARQIDGLPFHSFEADGEMQSQLCTEVLLNDHQIEYLQDQGIMALAAMKNRDVAVLMRFQSIAEPLAALAGRWNSG